MKKDPLLTRRRFIKHTTALGGLWLAGCGSSEEPLPTIQTTGTSPPVTPSPGSTAMMDMASEMGSLSEMGDDVASSVASFTKPPFIQRTPTGARLRFETLTADRLQVRLERRGGSSIEQVAMSSPTQMPYKWPSSPGLVRRAKYPDTQDLVHLQQADFKGLIPGERYDWLVHRGDGVQEKGSFIADADPTQAFRLGFIADTMQPASTDTGRLLAGLNPDFVLHGGDLQYMTFFLDTWNGFFHEMAGATSQAMFQPCVGNHEYEEFNEFDLQYKRMFEGHGDAGSTLGFGEVTFGGTRFIYLNSETDWDDITSDQHKWMLGSLDRAKKAGKTIVVMFHRPFFTFSKSSPNFTTRDLLHPLFRDAGVSLVLTGHNHCYERFEVEGITYVVDGGGGAGMYNPNHKRDSVLAKRPSDEGLRKAFSEGHGVVEAMIQPDGTMTLKRHGVDGKVHDEFTIG